MWSTGLKSNFSHRFASFLFIRAANRAPVVSVITDIVNVKNISSSKLEANRYSYLATIEKLAADTELRRACKFLTNFDQILKLHDPNDTDVAELTKQKHMCYYMAGEQVDKNPQMATEILPRFEK